MKSDYNQNILRLSLLKQSIIINYNLIASFNCERFKIINNI